MPNGAHSTCADMPWRIHICGTARIKQAFHGPLLQVHRVHVQKVHHPNLQQVLARYLAPEFKWLCHKDIFNLVRHFWCQVGWVPMGTFRWSLRVAGGRRGYLKWLTPFSSQIMCGVHTYTCMYVIFSLFACIKGYTCMSHLQFPTWIGIFKSVLFYPFLAVERGNLIYRLLYDICIDYDIFSPNVMLSLGQGHGYPVFMSRWTPRCEQSCPAKGWL